MTKTNSNSAKENSLGIYLSEISKIPLLKPKEELRVTRLVLKGDAEARRLIIVSNLRLVVSIAKKYMYYGLPLLDLIEEGNLGLMKAAERFDPERGCKFSTATPDHNQTMPLQEWLKLLPDKSDIKAKK